MYIPSGGIAFFDSGIGGLTVLHECRDAFPNTPFYYYGDNARAPYGNLPAPQISNYVTTAFEVFSSLSVRAAVLACNTATAICAEELRRTYPFPIIGAEPAVFPACKQEGEILVLATQATRDSTRLKKLCARAKIGRANVHFSFPECNKLAGVIEENILNTNFDYSPYLPPAQPNAVVLGCTHYIYIKEYISRFYDCNVYDGNIGIKNRLISLIGGLNEKKCKKSRDGQPPVTPCAGQGVDGQDFCTFYDNKDAPIFFLGSGKDKNLSIYEQMFAKPYK